MIAVDTNILARWVLGDDPTQAALAEEIVAQPIFVPLTVLAELGWVLERSLKLSRQFVADALTQVLLIETAVVAERDGLRWAIERFRRGADWADMLHLVASAAEAQSFVTFDRKLARQAGETAPLTVRVV